MAAPVYNHRHTHACFSQFINNPDSTDGNVRDIIASSWKRCLDHGIDYTLEKLPVPDRLANSNYNSQEWDYWSALGGELVDDMYVFLDQNQIALFYADLDLNIIRTYGNPHLSNVLKEINLKVGNNFSETNIGTNALYLSSLSKQVEYVAGAEHYMNVLSSFATIACPFKRIDTIQSYFLLITPCSNFSFYLPKLLEYMIKFFEAKLINEEAKLLGISTDDTIASNKSRADRGRILINKFGRIIHMDNWCQTLFNVPDDYYYCQLIDLIPHLEPALHLKPNGMEYYNTGIKGKELQIASLTLSNHSFTIAEGQVITIEQKNTHAKKSGYSANYSFSDLIGHDASFLELINTAKNIARRNSNILIYGESGTGKELMAQSIHNASLCSTGPFVAINCGALPRELIVSELFGYVEGSFTGARKGGSPGVFEIANGGTLFLDEIAELPLDLQATLLRILEEKTVTRIGGRVPIPIDVRIICATNKNLSEEVAKKKFREDLFYRLNVVSLEMVPLRKRKMDIAELLDYFRKIFNNRFEMDIRGFTPEALTVLQDYSWPGNVRELVNTVERGFNLCFIDFIGIEHLPVDIQQSIEGISLKSYAALDQQYLNAQSEKKEILYWLEKFDGNKSKTAAKLGIPRATFYRKLKFYNITDQNMD